MGRSGWGLHFIKNPIGSFDMEECWSGENDGGLVHLDSARTKNQRLAAHTYPSDTQTAPDLEANQDDLDQNTYTKWRDASDLTAKYLNNRECVWAGLTRSGEWSHSKPTQMKVRLQQSSSQKIDSFNFNRTYEGNNKYWDQQAESGGCAYSAVAECKCKNSQSESDKQKFCDHTVNTDLLLEGSITENFEESECRCFAPDGLYDDANWDQLTKGFSLRPDPDQLAQDGTYDWDWDDANFDLDNYWARELSSPGGY